MRVGPCKNLQVQVFSGVTFVKALGHKNRSNSYRDWFCQFGITLVKLRAIGSLSICVRCLNDLRESLIEGKTCGHFMGDWVMDTVSWPNV